MMVLQAEAVVQSKLQACRSLFSPPFVILKAQPKENKALASFETNGLSNSARPPRWVHFQSAGLAHAAMVSAVWPSAKHQMWAKRVKECAQHMTKNGPLPQTSNYPLCFNSIGPSQ